MLMFMSIAAFSFSTGTGGFTAIPAHSLQTGGCLMPCQYGNKTDLAGDSAKED
jgi:hypothetical protein